MALEVTDTDIFRLIQDYSGLGETGEIVIASRRKEGALLISPLRHDPETAFKKLVRFLGRDVKNRTFENVSIDSRGC